MLCTLMNTFILRGRIRGANTSESIHLYQDFNLQKFFFAILDSVKTLCYGSLKLKKSQ